MDYSQGSIQRLAPEPTSVISESDIQRIKAEMTALIKATATGRQRAARRLFAFNCQWRRTHRGAQADLDDVFKLNEWQKIRPMYCFYLLHRIQTKYASIDAVLISKNAWIQDYIIKQTVTTVRTLFNIYNMIEKFSVWGSNSHGLWQYK